MVKVGEKEFRGVWGEREEISVVVMKEYVKFFVYKIIFFFRKEKVENYSIWIVRGGIC